MMSSYGIFPFTQQMAPLIDDSELAKPLTLKLDEPASIVVRISGFPKPTVRWQVGRKRVKESPKFHTLTDGDRTHILEVSRVTRDLEQGVWVVATNSNGEDCCLIEVRTYEIVLKPRHFSMEQQSAQRSRIVNRAGSLQRLGSFSNSSAVVKRGGSILSLKEWKQEMAIRNKMRSVDDLAFTSDKASLMSGLGYSLSVDVGDSDDPDLDEQFHTLSRHRPKRPMPVATTRLVFAEVEPSRLVPVPNRSTANASRSEGESTTDEKIIAHPKQIEDECATESSKRNKRKVKKSVNKSTSTPGLSILETTQVEAEHFVSGDRSLSDLPGPRVTNDEDVWSLHGEKLADVCQKMLQMFPEGRMQIVDLKNIPIRETFEERDIASSGIKHLNGCVRVKQSKANKVIDMQTKPEVKIDNEEIARDKLKNKNRRMLPSEGKSNRGDDELLVNESIVDELSANQRRLNSLFHEVKQLEPLSNERLRKGSTKRRNKRKIRSRSLSEFSQETTDFARQDNQTDATNNVRREEQYDENYNVITVFEESAGLTARQRAKQKKIGNRRSLEFVSKETKTQKKTKALKKSQSESGQSGRMEYKAITPVEHKTNRTLGENEAVVAVRAFAEIESRTSEVVENEVSTSNMPDNGSTSKQAKRKTNSSTDIETGLQGQKESLEVVKHEIKTHKKIQKTPGKVNRLSKRKQNITITSSEISILSENDLPDSNKSRGSFSSKLLADANNCENPDALVVKEITDNSESTATSAEIEHTCRVNLKPLAKKKRKKQDTSIKEIQDISFLKTGAVDSKKDLGFLGDLEDHEDLEHCETFRDSKDLGNSKHLEDSRVLPEEETIVKMDREPRCGVWRPGGDNETFNEVLERDWEKGDENLANTSKKVNKTNTPVQVENKVENETIVVMEGITSSVKKDVEEIQEQIIVMDREPRGGNTWLNRNIESSNEESPDGMPKCKNSQTHEVSIRNIVADNGQKSLYEANNNVLQAEKSDKYRAAASATENSNALNNCEAKSSYITKPDFKESPANNGHMATTLQKEHNQDADAFEKPKRQVINTEGHIVGTKHKKKPNRRDTGNAVESISSDEYSGELFQSANSLSHQSTASKERDARTSNVQLLQEKESYRRSLNASVHLEIQTNDPALRAAPNSEQDIKTPNPLKSSANLNSIARKTGLRIQDSENNVQVSSRCTVDAVQHRLSQVTSPVGRLNSAMDQDKTDSDMTNEHTLILKALAERIRRGQVEIIVVNKMSTEEETMDPATPGKTLPVGLSANLTTLLNAHDTSEKVDASKPPMLTTIEEAPRSTTKHKEIKFIDSDDSVDVLEAGDQVSKPTDNVGTVENKIHIGSSVTKVDLPENRTGLPGITVGIPVTKMDLPATTAHLSATRVDLLGTIPYLPGTKVDMPGTKVDLSGTMTDLSETNSYLPGTKVYTNRQKSQMQNGQPPGTLVGVHDNILSVGPLVREDIASNMISERTSAPTVISCVNKTTENTMGVNTAESKTRSSRNTELESRPNLKETFLEMLPQTVSNPSEIRKSNSVKVGILKLEPPKPKPRNSISDGKSEKLHQNSTKPSAIAPTIIRTQRKLTDPNVESKDEIEIHTWRIKPTPITNLQIQQKPANDANESNDAKFFEGRLAMQKQPQPIPRTKLSTIKGSSWTKLSSDFATSPGVSEDKSSHRPNRQEFSERSDLRPVAAMEANAKTTFPVPHMQVLSDELASLSTDKYCSVATQVTTSDNDSSLSSDTTTIAVENVTKTTQVATSPILKSSTATQTTTAPVEKSSAATQITPVSDQKPLLTSTLPSNNSGTYTTSNIALNYRPIIGNHFAKSITPSVINYDRNSYALGHRYTPFTRYVSSPQHSWWNVYQRKLVPDYARETGLLRHQITRPQDDHTETSEKRLDSQEIENNPQSFASYNSGQLRNSTVTTQLDFSEINQNVIKDPKSLQQYQHSKQQEISEQAESVQNTVDVKPETSTLMPRQSPVHSTNGHLLEEPNRDGKKFAEMNDADLGWEQSNSSIRVCKVKDLESNVSTKTEDAVIEGSWFETNNTNKKGKCESSTEKKKEQYVSTMVTHEYGEVIVLYPAT